MANDLDLFVANYVDFRFDLHARIAPRSFPYPPGPKDFSSLPDSLYLNLGDGTFRDSTLESGIGVVSGPSMGSIAGDFDADGDSDIFVCCDGAPNHMFVNDGAGHFIEMGVAMGVAMDARGTANGSMGVDAADLNHDGIDDLLVTDYTRQSPMLFLSLAPGIYEDAAYRTRVGTEVMPHVNWSPGLVDFDNDGDADAFFCNGHFLKKATELEPVTAFAVPNSVMENLGQGRFRSVTSSAGSAL
ncbi:MAG: VCBS repeat-containing protein, partial [Planctomycetota bacterium]